MHYDVGCLPFGALLLPVGRAGGAVAHLVDLSLSWRPVSAGLIDGQLRFMQQAAVGLADELDLRKMTGRARYRARGIV